ncbi:hypothetical protein Vretimale_16420 [Volvox reticuliferus]|nr:hypothetical protein Vretimale_16420 [Volvox reticuliferus]
MSFVHQQSVSNRLSQKPSLIRVQYGGVSGNRDVDNEAEFNEEAYQNNSIDVNKKLQTRSLTQTWTSDANIIVDVNASQDEGSLSPTQICSFNPLRLSLHHLCSRNPGHHAYAVDAVPGAGEPTASHTVSPSTFSSAAATGAQSITEPYSSTSGRCLVTRQLITATSSQGPRGKLPSVSSGEGKSNRHHAVAVTDPAMAATGSSFKHRSSTARVEDEECKGSDEAFEDDDNGDIIDDNDYSGHGLSRSDYLIKPPGLNVALSCLRPQPPRAPRLQKSYCKSLEHFPCSNETLLAARFTADSLDTRTGAAAAPIIFPSTGGNATNISGDESEDFLSEWLLSPGRSGALVPHSPGSALKPTPPNPTRPSIAPVVPPRSRWVSTPQATNASRSGGLQPPPRPTSPPQPTNRTRKAMSVLPPSQSSSAAASGATVTASPAPAAQSPSSAPMTLLSHLLITADRPPWRVTRADSSLHHPPDDTVDFIVRPCKSVRGPPLQLSSFNQAIDSGIGTDGCSADVDSGNGGVGGPNDRRVTVQSSSAASSPTGYQAHPGPSSFSSSASSPKTQPQSPASVHHHVLGNMRLRQQHHHQRHHHQQALQSPEDVKDHLFGPLPLDNLPGSPATTAPTAVVQHIRVSSVGAPLTPAGAALPPDLTRRNASQPSLDDPLLAAPIVTAAGGNSGSGAEAIKHLPSHGLRGVGGGPATGTYMNSPGGGLCPQYPHQYQSQRRHQLPSPSANRQRRMGILQRKVSDGDVAALRTKMSFGGSLVAACSQLGPKQPGDGVAGRQRGGLGAVDNRCAQEDGSESSMARLFKTLNDLRRMESDAQNDA